jgi:ribulose bisphosphate carboxylase small subunit
MQRKYNSQLWEINARFTIEENREVCQRLSDYKLNHPDLPLRVINTNGGEPRVCTANATTASRMTGWFLSAIRR